jgi:hypothetical protein
MAGAPHDILVLALKEKPELLSELLLRVAGARLPGPIKPADSAVQFAVSLQTYPDLVFTTPGPQPSWVLVELQNRKDEQKARSWHLATSVLLQRQRMGDLIVITASRAVASWAGNVATHRGDLGTRKGLEPVVLYLSKKELKRLLDPAAPELALFAVWACCRGAGPEAMQVAKRAIELTEALPPQLQEAQTRAILAMVGKRLLEALQEMAMDVDKILETKASRAFREFCEKRGREAGLAEGRQAGLNEGRQAGLSEGLAKGKRASVLAVLKARGLTPSPAEQEQLAAVTAVDQLDKLLHSAVTATTMEEALAPLRSRPTRAASKGKKLNGHAR